MVHPSFRHPPLSILFTPFIFSPSGARRSSLMELGVYTTWYTLREKFSKYKGHTWDKYIDILPVSLKDHINGNAAYNLTHPLMTAVLDELDVESDTYFNAIPYDYRISQMITEGSSGTPSPFPFPKMRDERTGDAVILPDKMEKFQGWWKKWGSDSDYPYKESRVIANYAATNLLPDHLGDESIMHGKDPFEPWNPKTHVSNLIDLYSFLRRCNRDVGVVVTL